MIADFCFNVALPLLAVAGLAAFVYLFWGWVIWKVHY